MADWVLSIAEWLGPLGVVISLALLWLWKRNRPRKPARITYVPSKPTDTPSLVSVEENTTEARSVIVEAEEALQDSPEGTGETTWTDEGDDTATRGR